MTLPSANCGGTSAAAAVPGVVLSAVAVSRTPPCPGVVVVAKLGACDHAARAPNARAPASGAAELAR